VKEHAHPAIVTRAEFDEAQRVTKAFRKARDGSLAEQAMLSGLVRCAGCGHTLKITGTRTAAGARYPVYYCVGRYASGPCPARASEAAQNLDRYVQEQVLEWLRTGCGPAALAHSASAELEQATRAVEVAEHELALFVTGPTVLTVLGEERFADGVRSRQQALERAYAQLAEARSRASFAAELVGGNLPKSWSDLTVPERRRLMHGLLERITVRRARRTGSQREPVSERTQIILRGNQPL
jgi:hypothetical protein